MSAAIQGHPPAHATAGSVSVERPMKIAGPVTLPASDPPPITTQAPTTAASMATASAGQRVRQALLQQAADVAPDIDWTARLGPSTAEPGAVWFDGVALRNAHGLSIAQAYAAIEKRIAAVLAEAGHAQSVSKAGALRYALLDEYIVAPGGGDAHPALEIPYGSRDWAKLMAAMRTACESDIQVDTLTRAELMELGDLCMRMARQDAAEDPAMAALERMARAQGRLDPAASPRVEAQQLAAFAQEEFKLDAEFASAVDWLARNRPPTRHAIARQRLLAAGIDPNRIVDEVRVVDPLNPLAENPPRTAQNYYFNKDVLTRQDVAALLPGATSAYVDRMHERLPDSLQAEFARRFDAYVMESATRMTRMVELSIAMLARAQGIDPGAVRVSIQRPELQHVTRDYFHVHRGAAVALRRVAGRTPSQGHVVGFEHGGRSERYFVSYATGATHALPHGVALKQWAATHRDLVFGPAIVRATPTVERFEVAEGRVLRPEQGALRAALMHQFAAQLEGQRAQARGITPAAQAMDDVLGLVPFRNLIVALRNGDNQAAMVHGMLEVLGLLPLLGGSVRTFGAAARLLRHPGLLAGAIRRGLTQRAKMNGTTLRGLAADGAHSAARTAASSGARTFGRLRPDLAQRYAAALEATFPQLAAQLQRLAARSATPGAATAAGMLPLPFSVAPAHIPARLRIADPTVLAALTGRRAATNGVIDAGQGLYVQIGGHYARVGFDRGASSGLDLWRLLTPDGMPDTHAPRVVRARSLDAWLEVKSGVGLAGGHRPLNKPADIDEDHARNQVLEPVPEPPMEDLRHDGPLDPIVSGRIPQAWLSYIASDGARVEPLGRLSRTQTVVDTMAILRQLDWTESGRIDWNSHFDSLFKIEVGALEGTAYAATTAYADVGGAALASGLQMAQHGSLRALFVRFAASPTFNAIMRHAIGSGMLSADAPWTLETELCRELVEGLSLYDTAAPVAAPRTIRLPFMYAAAEYGKYYLTQAGRLTAKSPMRMTLERLIERFTGAKHPNADAWLEDGVIDEDAFAPLGLGERGAINLLANRVLAEMGVPRNIYWSHVPFDDSLVETRVGEDMADRFLLDDIEQQFENEGALYLLRWYVERQDRYIGHYFPEQPPTLPQASQASQVQRHS
jgi:hypothetical protein